MARVSAKAPAGRPAAATLRAPRDLKDRPRGWILAIRRQRRRVRPILYGVVALVLVASIAGLVQASSRAASLTSLRQRFGAIGAAFGLRVSRVVVQGRTTTPEPLLRAAIGVAPGEPMLGFSVAEARARIDTLASVHEARVERHWPGTILVSLDERHPFAVWQNQGKFVLIDRDGSLLADQDVRLASSLPLVVGAGAPAEAAALLDAMAAFPAIGRHVVAAQRVGGRRWNLLIRGGANILLPELDQTAALARLAALQDSHQVLDRKLVAIDLRLPDRIVLRPDAAAMPAPAMPAPALTPAPASARRPT